MPTFCRTHAAADDAATVHGSPHFVSERGRQAKRVGAAYANKRVDARE